MKAGECRGVWLSVESDWKTRESLSIEDGVMGHTEVL